MNYAQKMEMLGYSYSLRDLDRRIFKTGKTGGTYSRRTIAGSKRLNREQKYRITRLYNKTHKQVFVTSILFPQLRYRNLSELDYSRVPFEVWAYDIDKMKTHNGTFYLLGLCSYGEDEDGSETGFIFRTFRSYYGILYEIHKLIKETDVDHRIDLRIAGVYDVERKRYIDFNRISTAAWREMATWL